MEEVFYCSECGGPFIIDNIGVAWHVFPDSDQVDWDVDRDHVAFDYAHGIGGVPD